VLHQTKKLYDFCKNHKPYAGLIEIDEMKRRAFAAELKSKPRDIPNWRKPGVYPEDDMIFVNHSFWHSVVNFCYLDPENPMEKFRIGNLTGAEAMCHCFIRKFGERLIAPDDIFGITDTKKALEEFFRGDAPMPLLEERRNGLYEAALTIEEGFRGSPYAILMFAKFRVAKIIKILLENFRNSFGKDYVYYKNDEQVYFSKRANLWPLVYQGRALNSTKLPKLADPENIGPVVDYQVPNGLRHLGVHRYTHWFAEKIDSKFPLEKHSLEEMAVRFATAETLLDLQQETGLTQVDLDFPLWWEGRTAFKNGMNHMLVRTTDY